MGVAVKPGFYPTSNEPVNVHDAQVGGDHYQRYKIQPWDIIDEYGLDFYAGNVIKYLLRNKEDEDTLERLYKARHYLEKLIQRVEQSRNV